MLNEGTWHTFPVGLRLFVNYKRRFIDLAKTSGERAFTNPENFGMCFKFGKKE